MTAIPLNKGGSVSFSVVWGNGSGGAANLTGYTVSAFDVQPPAAASLFAVLMSNAATGAISGFITWGEALSGVRVASFRIRLVQSLGYTLDPKSTEPILVEVT